MAEVLSRSRDDQSQSYYIQPNSTPSSLKRSHSSRTSLLVGSPPPTSHRTASEPSFENIGSLKRSFPSSGSLAASRQSYSDFSHSQSTTSPFFSGQQPKLSFELGHQQDTGLAFPAYDEVQFFHEDEPLDLPPSPRPEDETSDADSNDGRCDRDDEDDAGSTTDTTRSDSPLPTPTVADDTAIKHEPSRHVDYLSHDWREEDIWSSWRHIVSQRKVYGQRSRLENASWRTWAKSKYHLPTVSPETLNWLKESDVTWLYGPLQPASTHPVTQFSPDPSPQFSSANSFVHKKPILKKRSMSEVMLQRSLSTSSLVKQAAAAVQAQQTLPPSKRPSLGRASTYLPTASLMVPSSRDQLDFLDLGCFSPRPSSGDRSPFEYPKRHIRFDEKVEQCIAVEGKDGEFGDESSEDERPNDDSDSDSSDDGIVMMRRPKRKRATRKPLSRSSSSSRTIEKLPSTTLKNKTEIIEPPPQPASSLVRSWSSSKLPQSASQETLKPANPSKNHILPPDDEESEELDSDDTESLRLSAFANRRDSVAVHRSRTSGSPATTPSEDEDEDEGLGMRRSASGMFMPYEEDEDDIVAAGLFGKVSDTLNTAKDIAHVIWNVGWRK
ncbi:hypothetical protein E4T43_04274 [Aureobasidium subglaciale]|nr:hypothetical protein E4T43_04274 [Aureobasidium subglaciale]